MKLVHSLKKKLATTFLRFLELGKNSFEHKRFEEDNVKKCLKTLKKYFKL
jgi:hypothetical protein